MLALDLLLLFLTLTGHFAACVWTFNRLHARHLPRQLVWSADRVMAAGTILILAFYVVRGFQQHVYVYRGGSVTGVDWIFVAHAAGGIAACLVAIPCWIWPRIVFRVPAALLADQVQIIDLTRKLGHLPVSGREAKLLAKIPGNQFAQLAIHTKELRLPRWPKELDGLSIVHLSDLHMTGDLTLDFYQETFLAADELRGDLVVVAGDILEKEACLPWIAETFGQIQAPMGQFFVFGNHELRLPKIEPLEEQLANAGWTNLAGETVQLDYQGQEFLLAGNATPWFGSEPRIADVHNLRGSRDQEQSAGLPRILLAHTPDLYPWAQRHRFNLMLAGHTHGGQIRFPFIGPLISPSTFGFRYASGVFHEGPTVMHVSRGLSGEHPIRIRCRPEITKLVLRA